MCVLIFNVVQQLEHSMSNNSIFRLLSFCVTLPGSINTVHRLQDVTKNKQLKVGDNILNLTAQHNNSRVTCPTGYITLRTEPRDLYYTMSQKNCANLFFAPCLSTMNRF